MTTSENSPDSSGEPVRYHIREGGNWTELVRKLDYDRENIPVTVNFDMTKVIGTASVREDPHGLRVDMYITDPEAKARFFEPTLDHFSVSSAHLVRDKDEEGKLPWRKNG